MACKTYHKGKYYISFKRGFEDYKKDISVTVDKLYESDTLKISLSDDDDPTFLFVLLITRMDYEDLKKQQGLLVDFDNFPSQLVRLLQQCASNNMFLIMQQKTQMEFYLEVIEHNEFKRLVHLSLKTGPATDTQIISHMAETISSLKKAIALLKNTALSNETILNDKCLNMEKRIHDMTHTLSRMEDDKLKYETEMKEMLKQERDKIMQEKILWQENAEINMKTQTNKYQENLSKKDKQIEELNFSCRQLRDNIGQIEHQLSEKSQCYNMLEKEVQKSHIEVATLKAKNATLERDIMEKDKLCNQLNTKLNFMDKTVKDNADTIKDINSSLQICKKEKQSLEERLALSETLVNKNNDAVHSTSEQLLKANQIISKLNADLIEMKEKLLCRTAIALEQEKVIERNSKEIEDLKTLLHETKQNMNGIQKQYDDLREKYESNEKLLNERDETIKNNNMVIQWLHKKMENTEPTDVLKAQNKFGIKSGNSSTPYFISRNNYFTESSHGVSDDSIDFYATSKSSNLGESSVPEVQEKSSKVGLDPKYLQPAENDTAGVNVKGKTKPHSTQSGKENMNINLPKVNYRDKKSARGSTTYRATPVSAYFP